MSQNAKKKKFESEIACNSMRRYFECNERREKIDCSGFNNGGDGDGTIKV